MTSLRLGMRLPKFFVNTRSAWALPLLSERLRDQKGLRPPPALWPSPSCVVSLKLLSCAVSASCTEGQVSKSSCTAVRPKSLPPSPVIGIMLVVFCLLASDVSPAGWPPQSVRLHESGSLVLWSSGLRACGVRGRGLSGSIWLKLSGC